MSTGSSCSPKSASGNVVLPVGNAGNRENISTNPNKTYAVSEWLVPSTIKQMLSFPGVVGYYQRIRFLPLYMPYGKAIVYAG